MKKILVTGGAGYIGSHTIVELKASGYEPIVLDNFSNSDRSVITKIEKITVSKIKLFEGNFQDTALLDKIFTEHNIEGIIHFAAFKAVGESVDKPLKYYDNNVAGFIDLLSSLENYKIPNIVFSSSCTVYGEPDSLPLSENSPTKPASSPYGSTKQMCETILSDTTKASNNIKSLALRYFNPIGAHSSALIGELPIGAPANLVPFVTQTAAGWREKLIVFGNDYPTRDGTNVRDYIHVVDLAKAHVSALDYLMKEQPGSYDVVNIGTGRGSTVLEVINLFEKATGQKVHYEIGPRRAGDIVSNYAEVSKAKKLLNWESNFSLEQSLSDAWKWQKTLKREL